MRRAVILLALAACGGGSAPRSTPPTSGGKPDSADPARPGKPTVEVSLADVGLDAESLDRAADPCEDFYQFACGGWEKKTQIPADQGVWGRFEELQKRNEAVLRASLENAARGGDAANAKIGAYWAACMDEAAVEKVGLKPLAPLFASVKKVKDAASVGQAIARLHESGVFALFSIGETQDYKDSSKVIAAIDQSGLGLPGRDYYLGQDDRVRGIRKAYVAHVDRMFRLAGRGAAEAKRSAADVLAIETEMAKNMLSNVERRDPVATFNRIDRAGLLREAPTLGWTPYFQTLGHPEVQDITVTSVAYVRAMDDLLTRFTPAQWRAYLTYQVLAEFSSALPRRFVDEKFTLDKLFGGQKEQRPRWRRCISAANTDLAQLVAQPFVAKVFGPEVKSAAEDTVKRITEAFGASLDSLSWLDDATRVKARQKLAKIELLVGYPQRWRSYDFEVDRGNHLKNHILASRWELARQLDKLGKPVDRVDFHYAPQLVNAYCDQQNNQVVLLAGILQPRFYDVKASPVVNLGGLGMVAGHELTHDFDDTGAQFDQDGNLSGWWSDEVTQRFKERTGCVARFYSGFEALPGLKLNGDLENGENIADIGGLKAAFRAYRQLRAGAEKLQVADGFSEDQQFFIAHGQAWCEKVSEEFLRWQVSEDRHAPSRYRVNGPVAQIPEFAEAFKCKRGSAMRAEKVCEVW